MLQTIFTEVLRRFRDTRSSMIAFGVSLFGLNILFGSWLSHYSPCSETLSLCGFYIGLGVELSLLAVILVVRFQVVLRRFEGKRIASPREIT